MGLLEKLVSWAQKAWNWLNKFFRRLWGFIQSWWGKLKQFLKDALNEFVEVVVLDQRQAGGKEFVEALRSAQPDTVTLDDIENSDMVTVGINSDGTVGKVNDLNATAQNPDQFDGMSAQNNGILRVNG